MFIRQSKLHPCHQTDYIEISTDCRIVLQFHKIFPMRNCLVLELKTMTFMIVQLLEKHFRVQMLTNRNTSDFDKTLVVKEWNIGEKAPNKHQFKSKSLHFISENNLSQINIPNYEFLNTGSNSFQINIQINILACGNFHINCNVNSVTLQ